MPPPTVAFHKPEVPPFPAQASFQRTSGVYEEIEIDEDEGYTEGNSRGGQEVETEENGYLQPNSAPRPINGGYIGFLS